MATQNPLPQPGQWVQLAPVPSTWKHPLPTAQEQTIGRVRQAFTQQGETFYQIVWLPGTQHPETGLYRADQLTCITDQQATNVANQLASGSLPIQSGNPTQPTETSV
jgi:hypothetical protein